MNQAARGLALWIAGAGEKRPEAPALDGHFLATVVAILDCVFAFNLFTTELRRKVLDVVALRIARTAQEKTMTADTLQQFSLAALFTFLARRNAGLVRLHLA